MEKNGIEDQETLYRMSKKSNPDCWLNKKPMPAFFIDPQGASVDRDGGRSEEDIIDCFKSRFKKHDEFGGMVKITAQKCREAETCPKAINNKKNKHHAEVHNSETEVEIELLKALRLSDTCEVVIYNE